MNSLEIYNESERLQNILLERAKKYFTKEGMLPEGWEVWSIEKDPTYFEFHAGNEDTRESSVFHALPEDLDGVE